MWNPKKAIEEPIGRAAMVATLALSVAIVALIVAVTKGGK